ncbi:MAG: hypothetical protein AAF282_06685 [Cyanobacteria bacterium P01_A01_bin.15]
MSVAAVSLEPNIWHHRQVLEHLPTAKPQKAHANLESGHYYAPVTSISETTSRGG